MGGCNHSRNLVELTIPQHASAHLTLYLNHGKIEDYIAFCALSGKDELREQGIVEMNRIRMTNRFITPETRYKMRQSKIGKTFKHDEETKNKIGLSNSKPVYCIQLDKSWSSCSEAAKDLECSVNSISQCCLGRREGVFLNRDKPGRGRPKYRFKFI